MRSIFLILLLCGFIVAVELRECLSDADKISGCVAKIYYENGNLETETHFKNGKKEGIAKEYDDNGNLRA